MEVIGIKEIDQEVLHIVTVSKHAEQRMKERCGLNKKSIQRMAEKAYTDGISHRNTKGSLNKWVTKVYFKSQKANNIRLYGDTAFLFHNDILITVIQIPAELMQQVWDCWKKRKVE